ncbi:MAG: GH3 auxin-responsive promoter family protein [Bacteroidales bacterium]|nr:GH3 auxin-responsive promoter family protein [Bacteroidales bacterium]
MDIRSMLTANILLGTAGGYNDLRLRHSLRNPRRSGAKALRSILSAAKDTVYGREHDFAHILEAKDDKSLIERYREAVAANQYEDLRPYVERMKGGEPDVLFAGKPVMYAKTSGSTAQPKWIPISRKYLTNAYSRMTKIWLFTLLRERPDLFGGKILTVVDKLVEGYAPDGTMAGAVSAVLRTGAPKFIKDLYSNPLCVFSIADYEARYYTIMRMGIERDVRLVVMANPSSVVELLKNTARHFDDFISDVENGTISDKVNIEPEIRRELQALVRPNPARAAELRALKERYGEPLPKHYWPNVRVLNTWKCGNTKIYIDKFKGAFPDDIFYPELGYFASECRFGVVLDDSLQTVPAPGIHYFEFVPEEDLASGSPRFLCIDELEEGHRYCPYVTTNSGLYRFSMNDLVEAGPKYLSTPTLRMVQKTNGAVSITGEKLSEWQVVEAVRRAAKKTGSTLQFFIRVVDVEASGYHFYYEFAENVTPDGLDAFNALVDAGLMDVNQEYRSKRTSLRLNAPAAHLLVSDSYEKFKRQCMTMGARDGQFKISLLLQDETKHSQFKQLVK